MRLAEGCSTQFAAIGIEGGKRIAGGQRHRWRHRPSSTEPLLVNGAERRDQGRLLRSLGERSTCHQIGHVVGADLARQDQQQQDGKAEGDPQATLRPSV